MASDARAGVQGHFLRNSYTQALIFAGITPVLVPSNLNEESLRVLYERVDGVLLPGGGDVDPCYLGMQDNDPDIHLVTDIDRSRDQVELRLTRWAFHDDKPLLGICRGQQVMNVALGGSLILDIPSQIEKSLTHKTGDWMRRRDELLHSVEIRTYTRLAALLGDGELPVNSIHHQAVNRIADGLEGTACAPDGIVEAIEAPDARFFVGVQWHPEEIYSASPRMQALFTGFAAVM